MVKTSSGACAGEMSLLLFNGEMLSAPFRKTDCGVGWYVWRPGGGVDGGKQVG